MSHQPEKRPGDWKDLRFEDPTMGMLNPKSVGIEVERLKGPDLVGPHSSSQALTTTGFKSMVVAPLRPWIS